MLNFNKRNKFKDPISTISLVDIQIKKMIDESLVSLDADEMILNLNQGMINFIKKEYGKIYRPQDAINWEYVYKKYPKIIEMWASWELYSKLQPIEGAVQFVNDVKERVGDKGLQIVTSSPDSIQGPKVKMIQEMFDIEKVFQVSNGTKKSTFTRGTILVDDALHNIDDHIKTGSKGIIFNLNNTYGWNKEDRNHPLIHRASNYKEVLAILDKEL